MPKLVLTLRLLPFIPLALTAQYRNSTVCVGPYVLCATAFCDPIPGNTTHVTCSCAGLFNGLNAGPSTCEARTETFLSTFSLLNPYGSPPQPDFPVRPDEDRQPTLYAIPCTGSNAAPWASCYGAPCTISPGNVTCTCSLRPASDNFYYGPECPGSEEGIKDLCLDLRSASNLPPGTNATSLPKVFVEDTLGSFYGVMPVIESCVPRANGTRRA